MKKIRLTQGKSAIVDISDYNNLKDKKWHAVRKSKKRWYARSKENGKMVFMHRKIMKTPKGKITDHINGDGLDNRKRNLRICSPAQNIHNQGIRSGKKSSQYKGVSWSTEKSKWRAQIVVRPKSIHLGYFDDEESAAEAYDNAAEKYFGNYARVNL